MIDGSFEEFIDQLNYGQEIVFIYQNHKYFIQGWWSDDRTMTTMVLTEVIDGSFSGYLWEYHADKMSKCADAFLSANIWNGKNFLQIEKEVTWSDW